MIFDGHYRTLPQDPAPKDWPWVIELTQGYSALVDEIDHAELSKRRWKVLKAGHKRYACRTTGGKTKPWNTMLMHRVVFGATEGEIIDHKNGNGLDNRRSNLRLATVSQNGANIGTTYGTSRFKGVHWNKRNRMWHSQIGNGKTEEGKQKVHFLGFYESEEEAALAYDRKASELFGEFACSNLPGQDDGRILNRSNRPNVHRCGEDAPSAKLKAHQAREIKCRALDGENQRQIASEFGVSVQLVGLIKKGAIWKCLNEQPKEPT